MESKGSSNTDDRVARHSRTFTRVTQHLKAKDFKWLKDDMGLFEFPENWDLEIGNDNRKRADRC